MTQSHSWVTQQPLGMPPLPFPSDQNSLTKLISAIPPDMVQEQQDLEKRMGF